LQVNRFEKALLSNSNNDAKSRTVCSQEEENGIECLHIKFTFVEDVFESRTTQKQGENAEYMFEDVVAYDSKVKLFFSIIIFNTCDEWTLHHDMCSMSFTEVLT
jgi:hypothetical protein